MKKNSFIAVSLAAFISLTPTFTTNAFADVDKDIALQDLKIDDLKGKKSDLENQLANLVTEIEGTQKKAKDLQENYEKTNQTLKQLSQEIKATIIRIKEREGVLKERARAMQKTSNSNAYLDVILGADNFADLVSRVEAVNGLVDSDQSILEAQQKDQKTLQEKQNAVKEKQQKQRESIQNFEVAQGKMAAQKAQKEAIVAQLALEQASAEKTKAGLIDERMKEAKAAAERAKQLAAATAPQVGLSNKDSHNNNAQPEKHDVKVSSPTHVSQPVAKQSNPVNSDSGQAVKPSGGGYAAVKAAAESHIGKPYLLGAIGPDKFDCSGFTLSIFKNVGISLPRTAALQFGAAKKIDASEAKPGDLVFFNYGSGIAHVGLYVGGGQMIDAQSDGVKYDNLSSGYWARYLVGYGRVANF